jgi:hypothetical protein
MLLFLFTSLLIGDLEQVVLSVGFQVCFETGQAKSEGFCSNEVGYVPRLQFFYKPFGRIKCADRILPGGERLLESSVRRVGIIRGEIGEVPLPMACIQAKNAGNPTTPSLTRKWLLFGSM